MITNINFDKDNDILIICAEANNIEKQYTIKNDYFLSKDIDTGEEYELNEGNINNMRYDGLFVMGMIEELLEVEKTDILITIGELYLRGNTVEETYEKIIKNI